MPSRRLRPPRDARRGAIAAALLLLAALPAEAPAGASAAPDGAAAESSTWIASSRSEEAHVERLQRRIDASICRRVRDGAAPGLGEHGDVVHDLAGPRAPGRHDWISARTTPPASERRSDRAGFAAALVDHFAAFSLVNECETHVFSNHRDETGRALGVEIHLSGLDRDGALLEQIGRYTLRFAEDDRLRSLRTLSLELASAAEPLFVDVTEAWLPDAHWREESFSPLDLSTPGNLDFGGLAVVDIDRDGELEIYVARSGANRLFERNDRGRFVERAAARGIADPGNGRGVLFFDADGDRDLDLLVANQSVRRGPRAPLRFYRQGPEGRFHDETRRAFGAERFGPFTHASAADIDGDGDLDLFVAAYGDGGRDAPNHVVAADNGSANLLLVNDGQGRFRERARERGVAGNDWSYAAAFADADDDGDADLFVANDWGPDRLHRNDGTGHFEDASVEAGVAHPGSGMGALWSDLDGDDRLDLYLSNMYSNAGSRLVPHATAGSDALREALEIAARGNAAYVASADGSFEDRTDELGLRDGGWAWGAAAFDADLDGDEDLVQANGYYSGTVTKDL